MNLLFQKNRVFTVACLLLAALFAFPASAQLTATSRVELTNETTQISLGPAVYVTPDEEHRLNEQIVASRHENNLRGMRGDSDIINLGLAPKPVWLVFSVTNNSAHENWVLNFGGPSVGRYGLVNKILVKNFTSNQVYVRAMGEDGQRNDNISGPYVPVHIGVGKTELFVVYLEADSAVPATFVPTLMTEQQNFKTLQFSDFFSNFIALLLITAAAFFGAVAYLEKTPQMALFSGYYLVHLVLFMLIEHQFFEAFSFSGQFTALLYPLCFLSGIAATWFFFNVSAEDYSDNALVLSVGSFSIVSALIALVLPARSAYFHDILTFLPSTIGMAGLAALAFSHGQRGKLTGHFIGVSWVVAFIGASISILAAMGAIDVNALFLNAYWISLLPQAAFFMIGTSKKIQMNRQQERAALSKESRAQQSLARLKQSRETADQARLLRVIERERELMAELREQEIHRADEMREAKETADTANRAKSAFLAVVSHEIRTPMTGIMGILRLLKDTKVSKEQADYLLTIQKSGDTMMALLNDILDFEKIESGSMKLEEIDFDLPKLIHGVVTLMAGHAADRKVTLKSDIPEDFPAILTGDPTRLRQVLLNLVSNAIKFTENGIVTLHLRAAKVERKAGIKGDYEIYFGVEDTGIGISEEAQERLFTPFEQADSSVSRKYGGTGLGLAICQRLVAAMGGSIRLTSEIGVGSTFFFSILMGRGDKETSEKAENLSPSYTASVIEPLDILVIEDNEINRQILKGLLEKGNHRVTLADSGEQGLEIFSRKLFDVVFTDINLSGMNGLETAKTMRATPDKKAAETPIIAITGNVREEDIQAIFAAGLQGFIPKPIDYDRLVGILAGIHQSRVASENKKDYISERSEEDLYNETYYAEQMKVPTSKSNVSVLEQYAQDLQKEEEASAPAAEPVVEIPAEPEKPKPDFSQVLDMKMLEGLRRSLGKDQMAELLKSCTDKTDEILAALQATTQDQTDDIRDRAHELKGMAANFGMKELARIAGTIEKAAQNGKDSATHIERLPDAVSRTKEAIESWLI